MKKQKEVKTLGYYLNMIYPIVIYPEEEGGFVAEIEELPGCLTEGETLEETAEKIESARRAWIEVAYEDKLEIPLPRTEREYSGRFVSRIPSYLHQKLSEQAECEGVSLNQYIITLLSAGSTIYTTKMDKEILLGEFRKTFEESFSRFCALQEEKKGLTVSYILPRQQWVVSGEEMHELIHSLPEYKSEGMLAL